MANMWTHPSVVALCLSLLWSIGRRFLYVERRRRQLNERVPSSSHAWSEGGVEEEGQHCKLLLCSKAENVEWEAMAWNALQAARQPNSWQICVLLECEHDSTRVRATALDSRLLRRNVRVEYTRRRPRRDLPAHIVRRLAKRFVLGDESLVVIVGDVRARFVLGWDHVVVAGARAVPAHGVLSCPTPDEDTGRARFPTLRLRSTGTVARDTSQPFYRQGDGTEGGEIPHVRERMSSSKKGVAACPSVCWCPELTVVRPSVLLAWPIVSSSRSASSSLVAQADARPHAVLTTPVLEPCPGLEDDLCDTDDGCDRRTLRACETAGLTPRSTDEERILKFGSALRAKLAIKPLTSPKHTSTHATA